MRGSVHGITKEIGFHKSLMVMDALKAHFTDDVAAVMLIRHTSVVKAPPSFTFKVQLLDVNKPFLFTQSECWEDQVVKVVVMR